jgi:hypothetical protein
MEDTEKKLLTKGHSLSMYLRCSLGKVSPCSKKGKKLHIPVTHTYTRMLQFECVGNLIPRGNVYSWNL